MINRYVCLNCNWWADISDNKEDAYFSTEFCPKCKNKLKNIGIVNKI